MGSTDDVHDRHEKDQQEGAEDATEREDMEAMWTPPECSDQAPGEETVQVNDAYAGGEAPPAVLGQRRVRGCGHLKVRTPRLT